MTLRGREHDRRDHDNPFIRIDLASGGGGELGAESIDFLDLVFRLEEALGKKIPVSQWQQFLDKRLKGRSPVRAITVAWVQEFAEEQATGGATETPAG